MSTATKPNQNGAGQPVQSYRGIVKNVISGDCIVIKSLVSKDGKVVEKQLMLSNITAPRIAKKTNPQKGDGIDEPDQPYAFEAREFLRKKLVGREVCFVKDANAPSSLERGIVYLGKDSTGENINEAIIAEGLVEVRRIKSNDEENKLVALEEQAKSAGKGKWSKDAESAHVRSIKYSVENASNFVDSHRQKPIDAVVEYVRDGSTMRVLLLPTYHLVTLQLSGVRCPGFKRDKDTDQEVAEPFAEEAKNFVESRLLQRDVRVILEGVANQSNGILLGTVLHPNGNIAEFLLKDGLAKCVDWSMGVVSVGAEKYRLAEKQAKQAKLRLWKNYTMTSSNSDESSKSFAGKVVEILNNSDGLVLKTNDGTFKKIFLSSVRPPRAVDYKDIIKTDKKNNALYDVPYLFEAREFLRKKLINKKVNCVVDYVQPKSDDYPEKVCCTVMLGDTNIAEALISHGLAKAIRYKQDEEKRSSKFDELLSAESRAQKKAIGIHSTKEVTTMKIADVSGDANKAKQFLPSLQRGGKLDAIVEFVSSGSRFRLYLPKDTCLITFVLSGVDCPRPARPAIGNNPAQQAEEFGEEALLLSKSHTFQREVKVEIESVDKAGNFVGQLVSDENQNIGVCLLEAGYASCYRTQTNASYFGVLSAAEQRAKEKKINRWKNFVEVEKVVEETEKNEPQERVESLKTIVITEIGSDLHFYGQHVDSGPKLEQLTNQLRAELASRPPVPGAYSPKVGDTCVAKFSLDDEWYRARVLSVQSSGEVTVLFVDYGNKEKTKATSLAQMPAGFDTLPPQAHEYALAFVQLSSDEDDNEQAVDFFKQEIYSAGEGAEFKVNVEYKTGTLECVSLFDAKKNDIGKKLVAEGFVSVERSRRERRLQKLLSDYHKHLSQAKQAHKNMWRYGDKEQDDAFEFGVTKKN